MYARARLHVRMHVQQFVLSCDVTSCNLKIQPRVMHTI